ncbi:50S ribosomal protein L6 [Candidatus Woesearchaeota archaeon]|nr:50S ribosomal protein L6 [Candidatus Woesearchaeota archaeon]
MEKKSIDRSLVIPNGVSVNLDGNLLKVKGPKGETERRFAFKNVNLNLNDDKIIIKSKNSSRKFKKIVNSFYSHIKNIIQGVQNPYTYKLKICSGHFPMKVTQDKDIIMISNFLGEKIPRKAAILQGVSVKLDSDIITLTGVDKEATAQSAANIEMATKITKRDRRVFQDGVFLMK